MGVIANVQGIVIVSRSLDWTSYTHCSVTSVERARLFTVYSYMLMLTSVTEKTYTSTVAKYSRIIFEGSTA